MPPWASIAPITLPTNASWKMTSPTTIPIPRGGLDHDEDEHDGGDDGESQQRSWTRPCGAAPCSTPRGRRRFATPGGRSRARSGNRRRRRARRRGRRAAARGAARRGSPPMPRMIADTVETAQERAEDAGLERAEDVHVELVAWASQVPPDERDRRRGRRRTQPSTRPTRRHHGEVPKRASAQIPSATNAPTVHRDREAERGERRRGPAGRGARRRSRARACVNGER